MNFYSEEVFSFHVYTKVMWKLKYFFGVQKQKEARKGFSCPKENIQFTKLQKPES